MATTGPQDWVRKQARFPGRPLLSCLMVACCLGALCVAPARSEDTIAFRLGGTTLVLERNLVRSQPSPRRFSTKEWMHVTQYDLDYGQAIDFDLREANGTFPCEEYFRSAFVRYRRHVDFPNPDLVADWRLERTSNPAITRLVMIPPGGRELPGEDKIERYRFEAPELNDYKGDRQRFVHWTDALPGAPSLIVISIRLSPEILIDVRFTSKDCFLQNGVAVTRHVRNFVIQRMRPAR